MKCSDMRVVLTGATGGIGRELARKLVADGAKLLLVARSEPRLSRLSDELGNSAGFVAADITTPDGLDRVVDVANSHFDCRTNVLINNAGTNRFGPFTSESRSDVEASLATNVVAPMLLAQRLVPLLEQQKTAIILNIGSILGSIGLPGQVSYSTSKFALHGFTESLRRELHGSSIRVLYAAPRATDTPMNSAALRRLNEETGVRTDDPALVANKIIQQLKSRRLEQFIGWPERLFVKLNALFPALVDRGSRKSARLVHESVTATNSMITTHGANL